MEEDMADAAIDKSPLQETTIEISLGKLQQLFNSLDPSPFHDRDLDHDAEQYIVGRAEEVPLHRSINLVIHLPKDQLASADPPSLERAIQNYFAYQQEQSHRRLRLIFHDGRIALAVGMPFCSCAY
jgi:hypothetical protein